MFTNIENLECDCSVLPPHESAAGTISDHLILQIIVKIPCCHSFEWIRYRTRNTKKKNLEDFEAGYAELDWEELIGNIDCPSQMTRVMHETVATLMDKFLSWIERKVKSNDDPWITDEIRRALRRRYRKYKKSHRSNKWKDLKRATDDMIRESKHSFYDEAVAKLRQEGSSHLPFQLLKKLAIPDRPKAWSVNSLRPKLTDKQLADELAVFFSRITEEFSPLQPEEIPSTYSSPFPILMPHEVSQRIKAEKKSKSAVSGDIPPQLAGKLCDLTAIPTTRIMNYSLQKKIWPLDWLTETQTVIPKGEEASTFDQLRNLSCPNSLSKILESFVLEKL